MAPDEIGLLAKLNDLLQLEHDALPAYQLAIAGLSDRSQRARLAGLPSGDRAILLAFKANEWQSQEKYGRRAAEELGHEPEVADFLSRAAADEARHYAWVCDALEQAGLGPGTLVGATNSAFARFHGMLADGIEGAGRLAMELMARTLRPG